MNGPHRASREAVRGRRTGRRGPDVAFSRPLAMWIEQPGLDRPFLKWLGLLDAGRGYDTATMTDQPSLATPYRTHTCGRLRADRRRHGGPPGGLGPPPPRPRPAHLPRPARPPRADPGRHRRPTRPLPTRRPAGSAPSSSWPSAGRSRCGCRAPRTPSCRPAPIELQATDVEILSEAKTPPFYINDPDAAIDERSGSSTATSISAASRCSSACCCAAGWSRRSARSTTATASSRSRRRCSSRARPKAPATSSSRPAPAGQRLRAAAEPAAAQAAADGRRHRPLLPDRPLLPRRGPARRPAARVHPARPRDELRRRGDRDGLRRGDGHRGHARRRRPTARCCSVPFPVLTFEEAIERFGSDKPDVRFGMELVDLAPALAGPDGQGASGFGVFDSALAAGGRVMAIAAPGLAGDHPRRDRRADRARQAVRREGPGLPALEAGRRRSAPDRQVPVGRAQRAHRRAAGASTGRPDPDRRRPPRRHRRRARPAARGARRPPGAGRPERAGLRLGPPLPDVPVGHGPRWDATHNPFSGVLPEDEALLDDRVRRPGRPSPDDPAGRARALQYDLALNGWELGGGSIRIHRRDLLERSFRAPGPLARGHAARSSAPSSTPSSTARRRTAGSPWASTAGRCLRRPDEHPRGHGVPEDPVRAPT